MSSFDFPLFLAFVGPLVLLAAPLAIWGMFIYRHWLTVYPDGDLVLFSLRFINGRTTEWDKFPKALVRVAFFLAWIIVWPPIILGSQ